jgi:hypothetical protein
MGAHLVQIAGFDAASNSTGQVFGIANLTRSPLISVARNTKLRLRVECLRRVLLRQRKLIQSKAGISYFVDPRRAPISPQAAAQPSPSAAPLPL